MRLLRKSTEVSSRPLDPSLQPRMPRDSVLEHPAGMHLVQQQEISQRWTNMGVVWSGIGPPCSCSGLPTSAFACSVFLNCEYNKTGPWLQKAYQESLKGSTVACLVAARPETKYWREWVWERACEIRFYTGRISFLEDGQPQGSPKFPSALVVYYGRCEYRPGGVDNHRHHHPIVRRVDRP
jgi:hypothetical protein